MASTISNLQRFFGKKTPDELVKKWRQEIRTQQRLIQRQIQAIDSEEAKVKKSIKQVAKKGDNKICKILAKELIRSQRHKNRLYTSKAQLNSIVMQLEHQLGKKNTHTQIIFISGKRWEFLSYYRFFVATIKVAGTLQRSGEVMKLVNQLVRLPELSQTMQHMSMEMTKAGLMDEMIEDTMEMMDDEDLEEAADEEVNNVLYQITDGMLGEAGAVGPALDKKPEVQIEEDEEEEGPELDMMQKRLQVFLKEENGGTRELMFAVIDKLMDGLNNNEINLYIPGIERVEPPYPIISIPTVSQIHTHTHTHTPLDIKL
ncbi:hypothetical protein BDB00DRAFT_847158 [Zychaea mexicana]|uniref:uncharacterized protein n=1 Tax=Zychaea mexicana TaxID=64656 RepID=UPI0022FDBFD8|nr:uncharacterized protein BDB00DRAFT_847158 [Zychaea mexicana]KAI9488621.1 hypothetical protein BDB00DRAFT_847158 [Zychaea mexicana]